MPLQIEMLGGGGEAKPPLPNSLGIRTTNKSMDKDVESCSKQGIAKSWIWVFCVSWEYPLL